MPVFSEFRGRSRVILRAMEMTLKESSTDFHVAFNVLVQPLLYAVLSVFMLKEKTGPDALIQVVVGSGLVGMWVSLLGSSSWSINGERWLGTLENLVGSPASLEGVVAGKILAGVLQSLASMFCSYGVALVVMGTAPRIQFPAAFAVSAAVAIFAFLSLGMVIAPFMAISLNASRWFNALEFPVYILCGFLFPISLLPGWTSPLSYALVPTWAARALQLAAYGGGAPRELVTAWAVALALSFAYLAVSAWLFRVAINRARQQATLGLL